MSNEGAHVKVVHFKVPNNLGLSHQPRCEFLDNYDGSKRCLIRLYNAKMPLIPNCSRQRRSKRHSCMSKSLWEHLTTNFYHVSWSTRKRSVLETNNLFVYMEEKKRKKRRKKKQQHKHIWVSEITVSHLLKRNEWIKMQRTFFSAFGRFVTGNSRRRCTLYASHFVC